MPSAVNNDRSIRTKLGSNFKAMATVKNRLGTELNFRDIQRQMDPKLLAELKSSKLFEDDQALFESYAEAHVVKYHQSFAPFTGGRW